MRRNNNFFKAFLLSVCFMITAFSLNALTAHAYSEGLILSVTAEAA